MLSVRLLSILFLIVTFAVSSASSAPWGDSVTGDLHWGESLKLRDYRLEAADFSRDAAPNPMVLLKLYKGEELLTQRPLSQGENFSFNDEILAMVDNITVPDRSENNDMPVAKVRLGLYAIPEIISHVASDKDSYEPGEEISLGLTVENQGIENASGIRIKISSSPELVDKDYGISELKAGEVRVLADTDAETAIRLMAPYSPGLKEFKIRARAEFIDEEGKDHESEGYSTFSVNGQLHLHKQVQEAMRLGTSYPVILTLRNPGANLISADVSDDVPSGFSTSSSLKWKVDVGPGKTESVSYDLRPDGSGGDFILPPATARYALGGETFESRSESPSVNVTGPRLKVEKSISSSNVRPGEEVEVSIDLENEGRQTVMASLNESLPGWARLISGRTSLSRLLKAGEKASLSYSIASDRPGEYEIPATAVSYANSAGDLFSINSSSLNLEVQEERPQVNVTTSDVTASDVNTSNVTSAVQESPAHSANYALPDMASYIWILFAALLALIYLLLERIL